MPKASQKDGFRGECFKPSQLVAITTFQILRMALLDQSHGSSHPARDYLMQCAHLQLRECAPDFPCHVSEDSETYFLEHVQLVSDILRDPGVRTQNTLPTTSWSACAIRLPPLADPTSELKRIC